MIKKKSYKRLQKRLLKKLIKQAKEFKAYSYEYMMNIICTMIHMYYNYFNRNNELFMDSCNSLNEYDLIMNNIKRSNELCNNYENCNYEKPFQDVKELKELFNILSEHICGWWD